MSAAAFLMFLALLLFEAVKMGVVTSVCAVDSLVDCVRPTGPRSRNSSLFSGVIFVETGRARVLLAMASIVVAGRLFYFLSSFNDTDT